jgi:hypothetical protein
LYCRWQAAREFFCVAKRYVIDFFFTPPTTHAFSALVSLCIPKIEKILFTVRRQLALMNDSRVRFCVRFDPEEESVIAWQMCSRIRIEPFVDLMNPFLTTTSIVSQLHSLEYQIQSITKKHI